MILNKRNVINPSGWLKRMLAFLMVTCFFLGAMPSALALSFHLPVNAGNPSPEGVRDTDYFLLSQASDHIRKGDYSRAEAELTEATEKNPVNLLALYHLGCLHLDQAKRMNGAEQAAHLESARDAFERVSALNENLALVYFKLGKIALMQNDLEGAKRYYRAGLRVEPSNAALFFNLARVYDQNNEKGQAIAYYRKTLALEPTFVFAYNNLGLLLEDKKDYRGAEKAYRRAIRLNPQYHLVHLNLANLYAATRHYTKAERLYTEVIRQEPRNEWGYYYQGNLSLRQGRYAQAVNAYEKVLALNPNHATAYYLMAVALSRLNRLDEALQAGLNYMRIAPSGEYAAEMKNLILSVKLSQSNGGVLFYSKSAPPSKTP